MVANSSGHFSPERVCQLLIACSLLTEHKAAEILKRKEVLQEKLEAQRKRRNGHAWDGVNNAVSIVDILASLKLSIPNDRTRVLDEEAIYKALAAEWGYPYKKIDPLKLDLNTVTTIIPKTFAKKHLVLPVAVVDGHLTVATPNPHNVEVIDDIARASSLRIEVVVSTKSDVLKLINEFFGFQRSIAAAEDQFAAPSVDLGNLEQYVRLHQEDELTSNDQHIVHAVNHLFLYAFDQHASDIHIEPKREICLVRMRIDGVLHAVYRLPKNVHSAIVSRIKNLSRMDMAEKRRPQDGRIKTDKGDVEVEIRVSTIPVAFGEKVVMRIMDPDILFQKLEKLGFTKEDYQRFKSFSSLPHGIVLVTGPTGSGKSTTLYSLLRKLYRPEINITTVEDPIEMVHEEFNQIAVQPQVGVTFGSILRNILRQDPDIIMIGEMRDLETAENAIQAALTGHLVLSTLHTNDAPSSIVRLIDLGVPHFLIQATLVGILAQRLVRKICPRCKEAYEVDAVTLNDHGLVLGDQDRYRLARGKGCQHCRQTGYRGRTGVFEVMPYTPAIRRLTGETADMSRLRQAAQSEGMQTLRQSAVAKLLRGVTTVEEVLRVTWEAT
ncbi:MAG: GspE/PulE family protein [Desulfosarcinaceae bacterium]|nr:GspE/PulE family protein [Desulfosarcinaceae bacterium]